MISRFVTALSIYFLAVLFIALDCLALPTPTHRYPLTVASGPNDDFGGPALTLPGELTTTDDGFVFNYAQGPSLLGALSANNYTLNMIFKIDSTSGWKKFIDFKSLGTQTPDDYGIYNINGAVSFWPTSNTGPAGVIEAGKFLQLVVTRNETTKDFAVYVNGSPQFGFSDNSAIGVFANLQESPIGAFLLDEGNQGFPGEHPSGTLRLLEIYDQPLSSLDVATLFEASDICPADPAKTKPGVCGCGVIEVDIDQNGVPDCFSSCPSEGDFDLDTDGDGYPDCVDSCPNDQMKFVAGSCGCGVAESDADGDMVPDCIDACPADEGKSSAGSCGCGVSDADLSGNGVPDCHDEEVLTKNTTIVFPPKVEVKERNATFHFQKFSRASLTPATQLAARRKPGWQNRLGIKYILTLRLKAAGKKPIVITTKKSSITVKKLAAGKWSSSYRAVATTRNIGAKKDTVVAKSKPSPASAFEILKALGK